jgi:hypothetical protein
MEMRLVGEDAYPIRCPTYPDFRKRKKENPRRSKGFSQ